jgi:hypothetical protein
MFSTVQGERDRGGGEKGNGYFAHAGRGGGGVVEMCLLFSEGFPPSCHFPVSYVQLCAVYRSNK